MKVLKIVAIPLFCALTLCSCQNNNQENTEDVASNSVVKEDSQPIQIIDDFFSEYNNDVPSEEEPSKEVPLKVAGVSLGIPLDEFKQGLTLRGFTYDALSSNNEEYKNNGLYIFTGNLANESVIIRAGVTPISNIVFSARVEFPKISYLPNGNAGITDDQQKSKFNEINWLLESKYGATSQSENNGDDFKIYWIFGTGLRYYVSLSLDWVFEHSLRLISIYYLDYKYLDVYKQELQNSL